MDPQYKTMLEAGLVAAVSAFLMGRTLKRLLLLPFELWARKSNSPVAKEVVHDAEQDAGLDPLPPDNTTKT